MEFELDYLHYTRNHLSGRILQFYFFFCYLFWSAQQSIWNYKIPIRKIVMIDSVMERKKNRPNVFSLCWELIHEIIKIMNECCWMDRVFFEFDTLLRTPFFFVYRSNHKSQPRWRNKFQNDLVVVGLCTLYLMSIYSSARAKFIFTFPVNERCLLIANAILHGVCILRSFFAVYLCVFVLKLYESYDQRENNTDSFFCSLVSASDLCIRWNSRRYFC